MKTAVQFNGIISNLQQHTMRVSDILHYTNITQKAVTKIK